MAASPRGVLERLRLAVTPEVAALRFCSRPKGDFGGESTEVGVLVIGRATTGRLGVGPPGIFGYLPCFGELSCDLSEVQHTRKHISRGRAVRNRTGQSSITRTAKIHCEIRHKYLSMSAIPRAHEGPHNLA